MHTRSKSSHHFVVSAAQAAEMRRAAALGDDICNRLAEKHRSQKLYHQIGNARGDDGDRRQMIADLISNDYSPFTPDDEEALRYMPDKTLREMSRQYLKANSHTQSVANRSGSSAAAEAMSNVGLAGSDFARRQAQLKVNSDAYIRLNPTTTRERAVTTNSNDEAVQAMSANVGIVGYFQKKEVL